MRATSWVLLGMPIVWLYQVILEPSQGSLGLGCRFPERTTNNLLWASGSEVTKGDLVRESLDGTHLLSRSLPWPLCPRGPLLDHHYPWYSAR